MGFCAKPPTGLGMACTAQSDCEGKGASYCESFVSHVCLVQSCATGENICQSGNACCDLPALLGRRQQPEVILMDINLPGMSGIQALKILRTDPLTASIPVLAISANAMPDDVKKGLEAGFFRYLTKPIKVHEFMAALELALAVSENEGDDEKGGGLNAGK
jgi:CheY-like chemotaxis protein